MSKHRLQGVAVFLTALALAEIVFSVAALGHRHPHSHQVGRVSERGSSCGSTLAHRHDHPDSCSHSAASMHESAPASDRQSPAENSPADNSHDDSDCSICRFLAQVVLPVVGSADCESAQISTDIVAITSFDVIEPAHRFPQPRSPPAVS